MSVSEIEERRQLVLQRARQMLEDRRAACEERLAARVRAADVAGRQAARTRLEDVRRRNKDAACRTESAQKQRAVEQQARVAQSTTLDAQLRHAAERHERALDFCRLRIAQRLVVCATRAHVNRSRAAAAAEERRQEEERRDGVRRTAAESARLAREIECEQRRLLHDMRALRSAEHQQQMDAAMRFHRSATIC